MYINDLGIKEINQYFSLHGGSRTACIKSFANYMEAAHRLKNVDSSKTAESANDRTADNSAESVETGNACCEKCQLTNQLLLQMLGMSARSGLGYLATGSALGGLGYSAMGSALGRPGYSAAGSALSGLGYSAAGSGALAAYQSLSKYLGSKALS